MVAMPASLLPLSTPFVVIYVRRFQKVQLAVPVQSKILFNFCDCVPPYSPLLPHSVRIPMHKVAFLPSVGFERGCMRYHCIIVVCSQ